jgi:hypothetical protein
VPEPGTWALIMTGFLSLGGLWLRRRKAPPGLDPGVAGAPD